MNRQPAIQSINRTRRRRTAVQISRPNLGPLTIGLIDFYRLTQECLTTVFGDLRSEIVTVSFTSVKHCIAEARAISI